MNEEILKKYARIKSIECEVEGMKAANKEREQEGLAIAYPEKCFTDAASKILEVVGDY